MGMSIIPGTKKNLSDVLIDQDLDMAAYNLKVDDIVESTGSNGVKVVGLKADVIAEKTAATGITLDGVKLKDKQIWQPDSLMPQNKDKVASDNLRHSIDGVEVVTSATYVQVTNKTLTFTHGIKGVIRVKVTIDPPADQTGCYKLLKDGVGDPLAVENCVLTDPLTDTDDLTVDWAAGTTLNVFAKVTSGNMNVSQFRVYYDDGTGFSAVPVAVSGAD